jgi:hypothetical protein
MLLPEASVNDHIKNQFIDNFPEIFIFIHLHQSVQIFHRLIYTN